MMLRIEVGHENSIEVDKLYNGNINIEVCDFGGSMENPWQHADVELTPQQAREVVDYLSSLLQ